MINLNPVRQIEAAKLNFFENPKSNIERNLAAVPSFSLTHAMALKANVLAFKGNLSPVEQLISRHLNRVDILFSDIDGTLRDESNGKIPESAQQAIDTLKKNNIHIILSSGRPYSAMAKTAQEIGLNPNYFVTEQGTRVTDNKGNPVYEQTLTKSQAQKLLAHYKKLKSRLSPDSNIYLHLGGEKYVEGSDTGGKKAKSVSSFENQFGDDLKPNKIVILDNDPKNLALVEQEFKQFDDIYVKKTCDYYCELFSKDTSKGKALEKVCELLNINLNNAAAIGDRDNDIEMMDTVKPHGGLAVCMGNSSQGLKQAADYITGDVKKGGFAQAMDAIIRNNSRLEAQK